MERAVFVSPNDSRPRFLDTRRDLREKQIVGQQRPYGATKQNQSCKYGKSDVSLNKHRSVIGGII